MAYEDSYKQVQSPKYECILFHVDDTLYPLSSGIAAGCVKNIEDYMHEMLGIEKCKIPELCKVLYMNYGTTMAGLRAIGYDFDYDNYHSFVHGRLPYDNLKPCPELRSLLLSLPLRKVIFTNADEVHASVVLSRLGLEDCFEQIICFETLNPIQKNTISNDVDDNVAFVVPKSSPSSTHSISSGTEIFDIIGHLFQANISDDEIKLPKTPVVCKPSEAAIEKALKIANIYPQTTLFFDDSIRNIQAGKRVGLHTVHVGTSQRVEGADYALENIHNIKEAFPELWESGKVNKVKHNGTLLETCVIS
ncbi:hypothetical protein LIER_38555 [Lithospermum erythrorhizon]|uniref:Uncharacterized protein n=1 Tax=Lithospermum erythrorhizon TaxID=34254 RepID=A0AAV3Q3W3_LITER